MKLEILTKSYHRILLERAIYQQRSLVSGKILDIGAKNRRYDDWFSGAITAVDLVPDEKKNIIYGDIERGLAFPDASFDAVVCIEVFEYIEEYKKALAETARLLCSGGTALISIPFMYPEHADKLRFTQKYFLEVCKPLFINVKVSAFGNGATIMLDALRKRTLSIKQAWFRKGTLAVIALIFYVIAWSGADKKVGDSYSGFLITATK